MVTQGPSCHLHPAAAPGLLGTRQWRGWGTSAGNPAPLWHPSFGVTDGSRSILGHHRWWHRWVLQPPCPAEHPGHRSLQRMAPSRAVAPAHVIRVQPSASGRRGGGTSRCLSPDVQQRFLAALAELRCTPSSPPSPFSSFQKPHREGTSSPCAPVAGGAGAPIPVPRSPPRGAKPGRL